MTTPEKDGAPKVLCSLCGEAFEIGTAALYVRGYGLIHPACKKELYV